MRRFQELSSYFIFPALVLTGHVIASRFLHLYAGFPKLDMPFHLAGGISIGYTSVQVLGFIQKEQRFSHLDKTLLAVLSVSLTATAAMIWEFLEFAGDQVFGANAQVSLANTMQDQFLGLAGGILVAIVVLLKHPGTI